MRITELADQDLDDLYEEGFKTWGVKQADSYYDGLMERFDRLLMISDQAIGAAFMSAMRSTM
ncbi:MULTISPECIES: hypothetical protein [Rhodobacterales]|uniref:type II toxin-antitoxin system RelE/ParE family toxin n=1 Tax=Rhodobacterales TaxID=204455 RepID=UPI0032996B1F